MTRRTGYTFIRDVLDHKLHNAWSASYDIYNKMRNIEYKNFIDSNLDNIKRDVVNNITVNATEGNHFDRMMLQIKVDNWDIETKYSNKFSKLDIKLNKIYRRNYHKRVNYKTQIDELIFNYLNGQDALYEDIEFEFESY